jgi:hypothetical protein
MSKNPKTGKWEMATWRDDYFGQHHYGVEFPDGEIYDEEKIEIETRDRETFMSKELIIKATEEANLSQWIQMEIWKWYKKRDDTHNIASTIISKVREIETISLSISIKKEILDRLEDIIELWFAVHDKTNKSFMTDDFKKFVIEKLK